MSKTKNGGSDQYGAEPSEQQQFGPAGVEGVDSPTVKNFQTVFINPCKIVQYCYGEKFNFWGFHS